MGREITQWTYNHLEPGNVADLPKHVHFEASDYTRLNQKTPQQAWTLFGQIRLWRTGYRPTDKSGDPTIFPLAMSLGLIHGATPGLAKRAAHLLADTGSSQGRTLRQLRQDHGVGWGVKKLREVTAAVSKAMARQRHKAQVRKLHSWLTAASDSTGRHKPVLSVGRDGITMAVRGKKSNVREVATTATLTVYDRRSKRLGTVYLAYAPQLGQATMTKELTRLLNDVLAGWQGKLPRLCYVSDSGDRETNYYRKALSRMKHPVTGEKLDWVRVVDYYHASERIWTMADQLFGKGSRAQSWARKMLKWLLKPAGVNRVLHSAVAFRDTYKLKGERLEVFTTAYKYLRKRMKHMKYAEYRRVGVPLGSGVTESACKNIYTQRLKLSGMRWEKPGAQTVLNLRTILLSDIWDDTFDAILTECKVPTIRGQMMFPELCPLDSAV